MPEEYTKWIFSPSDRFHVWWGMQCFSKFCSSAGKIPQFYQFGYSVKGLGAQSSGYQIERSIHLRQAWLERKSRMQCISDMLEVVTS
eukprot:960554-Amphidinium_carterae.1